MILQIHKKKEKPPENCLDLYKDPEKEEEKLRRDRFGIESRNNIEFLINGDKINVNELTPIEALNAIVKLKDALK